MKKFLLLILLLCFVSLQSYKAAPSNSIVGMEAKAMYLSEKFKINSEAVRLAIIGYEKLKQIGSLTNSRFLTIADFSKPSSEQRLYIIDMESQVMLMQTLVAHGRNSGILFAKYFSNKASSFQSSLGFYITGNPYKGKHGTSLELNGVEVGINDKAQQRAIVLHGADYVSNHFIQQQGYIGRSLGCPAVPMNQVKTIIEAIKGASCLFVYSPNQEYLQKSSMIH